MTTELKATIDELGNVVKEFKSGVDARIEKLEKGDALTAVETKLAEMGGKIDALDGIKGQLEALETKGNRPGKTEGAKDEYKSAFDGFIRKGAEDGLPELMAKAVSVGVDADGGYAVPETLDTTIEQLSRQNNPMRQVCNVMQVSNENYKKLVSLGGAASGWVGETDARTETGSPTLAQIAPFFGEIYANPAATQKSLDDLMFDVEAWLGEEVGMEFGEKENLAFTSGDGSNKAKGILGYTMAQTADGVRAFGEIQYRLSGTDGEIGVDTATAIDNLIDLTFDLKAGYRANAQFMVSRDALRKIRKLKDADGNLIWQPSLQAGQPSTLLGYPVIENEDVPAAGAESNSVLFGDFRRAYTIVDVVGTRVLRDPYTNKPNVHFYTTKRVGGFLVNSEAVKVLRLGNGA